MELGESFKEVTGHFWYTEEEAICNAKLFSKHNIAGSPYMGKYCSFIKGLPVDTKYPKECYAITNKYDPRVRTYMKQLNEAKQ